MSDPRDAETLDEACANGDGTYDGVCLLSWLSEVTYPGRGASAEEVQRGESEEEQGDEMSITLRFVGYPNTDFVGDVVRLGEGGGWATHVEVLSQDGTSLIGALPDGVKARPVGYDAGKFSREVYVTVHPPAQARPSDSSGYALLQSKIGMKYDFEAIAGIALQEDLGGEPDDGVICSMLVALMFQAAGYWPARLYVPPEQITPRMVLFAVSTQQEIDGL